QPPLRLNITLGESGTSLPSTCTRLPLTWNKSEFQDNYFGPVSGNLVQVEGNEVPDSPKVMFSLNGGW
ncbi:hypothetical protein XarbCFBP8150_21835, partial [Xanthomonas arboricola]